jgi:hypothetical protein
MERQVIYGVCDKTGECDSYFGFFRDMEDAKKEVQTQANRLKEDLGMMNIVVKDDRASIPNEDRVETIVIIIHAYVVR